MVRPFFTVGHSNQSIESFCSALLENGIELVIDIRTIPKSRANPQFHIDNLPQALAAQKISYQRIAALGGLRKKTPGIPSEANGYWINQSFHRYADYALTEPFQVGFNTLVALGRQHTSVIMCAEAVWWRCHRRIVADYLLAHGEIVFHIMGKGRTEPARLTPGAVIELGKGVFYPSAATQVAPN